MQIIKKIWQHTENTEMSLMGHLIELRERLLLAFTIFIITTIICILYIKQISYILQEPAIGIKFLQLAPGEYLFVSIKIAIYCGFIFSSPFTIYQIILFILPGLTSQEVKYIIPLLTSSIILFFSGLLFCFKILIPATLSFLISYGSDVIQPIWSFEEYFNFILLLLFSSGITFQIPIVQIILGVFNIYSSDQMLANWQYVIFFATVFGAIITPSTDPITQILMTTAVISLYFTSIGVLKLLNK